MLFHPYHCAFQLLIGDLVMQQELLTAPHRRIESQQASVIADFERVGILVEWLASAGVTVDEQRHISVRAAASASLSRLGSEQVKVLQTSPGRACGGLTHEFF